MTEERTIGGFRPLTDYLERDVFVRYARWVKINDRRILTLCLNIGNATVFCYTYSTRIANDLIEGGLKLNTKTRFYKDGREIMYTQAVKKENNNNGKAD